MAWTKRSAAISWTLLAGTALTFASATQAATRSIATNVVKAGKGDLNPFGGDIDTFKGDIDPFKGDLNPFWGDISPFYGDINPFKGDLNPFWGENNPTIRDFDPTDAAPAWTGVADFWNRAGASWNVTNTLWGSTEVARGDAYALANLNGKLGELVADADRFWGNAVRVKTGKSFADAFANPMFVKYGIDRSNPNSFAKLSTGTRSQFFLDWYDGLMAYSGADRVDHWMRTVRWSPALTQQQGGGVDTVIGLLDGDARGDAFLAGNIIASKGYGGGVGGHGPRVASLMVAPHDGKGIMGIAPRARVVAYNPFDYSGTASWADTRSGLLDLKARGASIINASLGVNGYVISPEWVPAFGAAQALTPRPLTSSTSTSFSTSTTSVTSATVTKTVNSATAVIRPIYVLAAGNNGAAQTQNIAWDAAGDPSVIVVGSTDVAGVISSFSNRPGTACLTLGGVCKDENRLMNRFIVAPGELILVSDGMGGVTRRTGTSFAAPLVSGAIALLHDRWPWLASYPKETASVILGSARDLGAKGVDPVYGVGMLDIERSQSPLDFAKLQFYQVKGGVQTQVSAPQLLAGGVNNSWDADGVYFSMFEPLGTTYRDFQVPMSSRLSGWVKNWNGGQDQFQRFLTRQFSTWLGSGGTSRLSDVRQVELGATEGLRFSMTASAPTYGARGNAMAAHSAFGLESRDRRFGFTAGFGQGALAIGGQSGFERTSDYASSGGGANPLLGLAAGGAFAQGTLKVAGGTVSFGTTSHRLRYATSDLLSMDEQRRLRGLADYQAAAVNLHVVQRLASPLTATFDYARIKEANALLGVQSTLAGDLAGGSTTSAYSIGLALDMGGGLTAAFTGTQGRTRTAGDQLLTSDGSIRTSAYALALQKGGVFGTRDLLRASVAQPLHIDGGTLQVESIEVIDRMTGEIGQVGHSFGIAGRSRQYVGEVVYTTPFAGDAGEVGLFGKGDLRAAEGATSSFVLGGRLQLRF